MTIQMLHVRYPWLPAQHEQVSRGPNREDPHLFGQQHRGTATLGAVAAVMIAFVIGSGVLWKSYREGASSKPAGMLCEVVCRGR